MNNVKSKWLSLMMMVCGLVLATPVVAQPATGDRNASQAQEAEEPASNTASSSKVAKNSRSGSVVDRQVVIAFGKDVELKAGESAEVVVVIGGKATIRGHVREAVVAIAGDVDVDSEVGEAVVAVLGSIKAGPHAKIHQDVVAIGGGVERDEGAEIKGETVDLSAKGFPSFIWLRDWFLHCGLLLRPLAPQVGWVWVVVGVVSFFYLLIAAVFPHPIQVCVQEITRRPATTFLLGLLTKVLVPIVFVLLTATGLGVLVVPFLWVAVVVGAIVGKIALTEWLGLRIGRQFGIPVLQHPLVGFLLGLVIILVLYNIPVLGFLTFFIVSIWGLGCAVTAAFGGLRRELPQRPPSPPSGPPSPSPSYMAPATAGAYADPGTGAGATTPNSGFPAASLAAESAAFGASGPAPMTASPQAPRVVMAEALAYPRAGFFERMGAGFLDLVLVGILGHMVGGAPWMFLVALAYFAGMWAWKGTTVGGIVLGLKVVRLDDQPVNFTVAFVRALAGAFSMVVLFLGFLWIIWDSERQGWHDRIAGTVVVRLPRSSSLVCL